MEDQAVLQIQTVFDLAAVQQEEQRIQNPSYVQEASNPDSHFPVPPPSSQQV
jgi:hypothetical protein